MSTLSRVAEAVGGRLVGPDAAFDSVSTDTRSLEAGALFFALRGPRFDAHLFIEQAAGRGATGAVVEEAQPSPLPQIEVPDTRAALTRYAHFWRRRFDLPLVAVTGSNGKTTVKEMTAAILRAWLRRLGQPDEAVLATWGNLNNDVGVPVTLLWLRGTHRAAVIEMGASRRGEIAALAALAAPSVAIVTNAGPAHLAGFGGSLRDVAAAKGELFDNLPPDSVAVINRDDEFFGYWSSRCGDRPRRTFGLAAQADFRAADVREADGIAFRLVCPLGESHIHLPMAGRHNVVNALAAAAATTAAGADLAAVQAGLGAMSNVAGRLRVFGGLRGATIYDDSYNANPGSVAAAIEFLAHSGGQRWLVLGDMAELGAGAAALHRDVGALARRRGIDRLYCVGQLSRSTAEGFGPEARWFDTVEPLIASLGEEAGPGVTLLVKASRSMALERVVQSLSVPGSGGAP